MTTIVITGAAGNIGTKLRRHFESLGWTLRLLDTHAADPAIQQADLAVWSDTWTRHFDSADAVIHLAADPSPRANWTDITRLNLDLTLNVFEAAARQHAKRLIFASSNWVVAGHRYEWPHSPPTPRLTQLIPMASPSWSGSGSADRSAIVGACPSSLPHRLLPARRKPARRPHGLGPLGPDMWLSDRDLCQGFEKAVTAPGDLRFAVLNLMSANAGMRWDLEATRKAIGYVPLDRATPRESPDERAHRSLPPGPRADRDDGELHPGAAVVNTPVCALDAAAELGEGAVWCDRDHVLWWVDINAPALHRFDPATSQDQSWPMPEPIGCLALGPDRRVVVALASGLAWFDPDSGGLDRFLPIEADQPDTRLNDGRCDRQGRFWVGSMERGTREKRGVLYRCDAAEAVPVLTGVQVPNCTAFSPDGRTMYFADTPTRAIRAFDLDPATGALTNERVFASLPPFRGLPDGATVDAAGGLWVAHWDGWRVSRFLPDGTPDRSIRLPVPRPTCCAFGGDDLGTLFITSARTGLDAEILAGAPLSGGLFSLRPGVAGLPEPRFRPAP